MSTNPRRKHYIIDKVPVPDPIRSAASHEGVAAWCTAESPMYIDGETCASGTVFTPSPPVWLQKTKRSPTKNYTGHMPVETRGLSRPGDQCLAYACSLDHSSPAEVGDHRRPREARFFYDRPWDASDVRPSATAERGASNP